MLANNRPDVLLLVIIVVGFVYKLMICELRWTCLWLAQVACEATSKCIEWLGGVGITREFPVEKYYRDCKVGQLLLHDITL